MMLGVPPGVPRRPEPTALHVAVHPNRGQVIVAPSGELDLSTTGLVGQQVAKLRLAGCTDIVIDLRAVTFMDSSGLQLLLAEQRSCQEIGCRLRLVNGGPPVRRVFELTGTTATFEFVEGAPS